MIVLNNVWFSLDKQNSTWLWRWLKFRLKCWSPLVTTVLFGTTLTWTIRLHYCLPWFQTIYCMWVWRTVSNILWELGLGSWHLVLMPSFNLLIWVFILWQDVNSLHHLDISDIKFVINFDFPSCSEDYVHRIGRTARSDRTGTSYTFFTVGNAKQAKDLISILKEANQHVNPKLMALAEQAKGMFGKGRSRFRDKSGLGNSGHFNRNNYGDSRSDSRSGGGGRSGGHSSFSGGGRGSSGRGGSHMSSANKSFNSNRSQDSRGGRSHSQQNGSWNHMGSQQHNMMGGGGYNNYSNSYAHQAPPPPPPGPPPSHSNPPQPLMQQQQYNQATTYSQPSYQAYQQQATNSGQGQGQQTAGWSWNQQQSNILLNLFKILLNDGFVYFPICFLLRSTNSGWWAFRRNLFPQFAR